MTSITCKKQQTDVCLIFDCCHSLLIRQIAPHIKLEYTRYIKFPVYSYFLRENELAFIDVIKNTPKSALCMNKCVH